MKRLLPSSRSKTQSSITLVENGCVISNSSELAEVFNDHFSYMVEADTSLKLKDFTNHPSVKLIADRESLVIFSFVPVSSSYMSTILHNLDLKKAVGVDGISSRLLRLSAPSIVNEITRSTNHFISSHSWPQEWKCSIVTPDEDTNKANYRPISILTALSKVYERIMYDQLHHAFQSHLSLNLSGFLKHHSCCSALLKMSEDGRRSLDNKEAVVAVAIDLSKAFDSIDHSLLLTNLGAYGLSSSALQLMSSYLTGRKQRVKVHGICSSYRDVKVGVPQVPFWGLLCLTFLLMI